MVRKLRSHHPATSLVWITTAWKGWRVNGRFAPFVPTGHVDAEADHLSLMRYYGQDHLSLLAALGPVHTPVFREWEETKLFVDQVHLSRHLPQKRPSPQAWSSEASSSMMLSKGRGHEGLGRVRSTLHRPQTVVLCLNPAAKHR